ncbi:hypothetical protein EXIGLDRAFT_388376 [Exidia glandulosa HHB12029]|uniref:Zn(2)-C6 fungal-type domain-containing protein n=1 Tax=Exidia glandulosa HHB12029 TaxID=1314781 RepID=A0A165ZBK8_EXIGL|nr:hypothetical protein EXIGLDRAFT_388376 [Exidia glandulosa HHB12029]
MHAAEQSQARFRIGINDLLNPGDGVAPAHRAPRSPRTPSPVGKLRPVTVWPSGGPQASSSAASPRYQYSRADYDDDEEDVPMSTSPVRAIPHTCTFRPDARSDPVARRAQAAVERVQQRAPPPALPALAVALVLLPRAHIPALVDTSTPRGQPHPRTSPSRASASVAQTHFGQAPCFNCERRGFTCTPTFKGRATACTTCQSLKIKCSFSEAATAQAVRAMTADVMMHQHHGSYAPPGDGENTIRCKNCSWRNYVCIPRDSRRGRACTKCYGMKIKCSYNDYEDQGPAPPGSVASYQAMVRNSVLSLCVVPLLTHPV